MRYITGQVIINSNNVSTFFSDGRRGAIKGQGRNKGVSNTDTAVW